MRGVAVATACVVLMMTRSASAQSGAPAAEALFDEGRAAMAQQDFDTACAKFRESQRLDPAVGTVLNLANCEEQRGRVATAWQLFHESLRKLDPGDTRIPVAKQRIDELAARLPYLRLHLRSGASLKTRVRVGDLSFTSPSFGSAIPLDPGSREAVVTSPGRPDETTVVELVEGKTVELTVPLGLPPASGKRPDAAPVQPVAPAPARTDREKRLLGVEQRTLALVVGGVGAAGLVVGTVTGILGLNKEAIGNRNCFDDRRVCNQTGFDANKSAHTFATISTVGFAVGLVGVAGGTFLYFTADAPAPSAQASNHGPAGFLMGWRGAW